MTERRCREMMTLLCIMVMLFVWVPAISSYAIHEDTVYELIVRGFNLIEFSWCGWIVLLAPLFWIILVCAPIHSKGKTILFYVSSVVTALCLVVSTIKAVQWLNIHGSTEAEYQTNFFCLLVLYLTTMLWGTVGRPKEFESDTPDSVDEDELY